MLLVSQWRMYSFVNLWFLAICDTCDDVWLASIMCDWWYWILRGAIWYVPAMSATTEVLVDFIRSLCNVVCMNVTVTLWHYLLLWVCVCVSVCFWLSVHVSVYVRACVYVDVCVYVRVRVLYVMKMIDLRPPHLCHFRIANYHSYTLLALLAMMEIICIPWHQPGPGHNPLSHSLSLSRCPRPSHHCQEIQLFKY